MKKKLLATLLSALVFAVAIAIGALAGCKVNQPAAGGEYYLSVLTSGEWTNYTSDSDIPTDKKFVKDGDVYTLSVELEQGDSVKIAQVGTDKTYGGAELFSTNTQLTNGSGNAISVGEAGTYVLTLDVSESTVAYNFTPKEVPGPTVASVEIADTEEFTLTVGGTGKQLTASAKLSDESTVTAGITWVSSDTAVVTVNESGLVTAVSAGTATIKAKYDNVESDPVIVNVNGTVTLSETALNLNVGGEATLTATAGGGAVINEWTSTDATVATVEDGKVTALKAGSATIRLSYTPRTGATRLFATCEVTVNVPVTAITLNNNAISVAAGSGAALNVGFTPADATNKNYTVAVTEGSEFISVAKSETDVNKIEITAIKQGDAKVTVTSEDGNKTATCNVKVVEKGSITANISASSLSLNKTGLNKTATLTVDVSGDTLKTVEWESSAEGVATVSTNGEVTAVAFGTTVITAKITTEVGQTIDKTCTVRVAPEHFFLYGDVGEQTWKTDLTILEAQKMIFEGSDGIYTLTYELPEGKHFRIGDDDDFGTAWVGLNYSNLKDGQNIEIIKDSNKNMKATKAGTYTLTIDITGATPELTIVCDAVAVSSIAIEADNSTLTAGDETKNSAVITLTVNPDDATYTQEDVEWTCESENVTVVKGENRLTVTAKDDAENEQITIACTVKGTLTKTLNLTVVAAGSQEVAVTEIAFEQTSYSRNINGNAWEVTVSAAVNSDATNQNVTYSSADAGVTVDAATGVVTASKVGTFTITATAAGDSTVTATATVMFYSDRFYLVGGDSGWGDVGEAATTVDTDKENYTFTGNEANTVYTLDTVLTEGAQFQIMYCGGNWDNSLPRIGVTLAEDSDASVSEVNMIVGGETGIYTVTIDLSAAKPAVSVVRKGGVPGFTATIEGASATSTAAKNRYTMVVTGVTLATDSAPVIEISGSAETSYDYPETLEAGTYRFDIVCDASGTVISANAVKIGSAGPVVSTEYALQLSGEENDWTPTDVEGAVLYYDASTGEYTFYFSREMTAWKKLGFIINTEGGEKVAEVWGKSDLGAVTVTDKSGSWLADSAGWDNMQSSSDGTMYCAITFTANGITSIICSEEDDLAPSTEPIGPVVSTEYALQLSGEENGWTPTDVEGAVLYYDVTTGEYTFYFSREMTAWQKLGFIINTEDGEKVAEVWGKSDLGAVTVTDKSGSWLADSAGWDNMQSSSDGTMYCAITFTANGITSITCSEEDDLAPSTETPEEPTEPEETPEEE